MDNNTSNRELANLELSKEIDNGVVSLSPILPTNIPDIPNPEESNQQFPVSSTNVNNYTVNVNVPPGEKPGNVKNVTNNIVKNAVESKQSQTPQELKKNSQIDSVNTGIESSNVSLSFDKITQSPSNNSTFNNFFDTQNSIYNTKGGIDNQNIFSENSVENSFYTKTNDATYQTVETPNVMGSLAPSEENKFLTETNIKENFIDFENINSFDNEINNFSSNQTESNTIMPSLMPEIKIPEFNVENNTLYNENSYIQKEADIIKQSVDGNSNSFIDNTSSVNNFLNTKNTTDNLMNNLFTNNQSVYNNNFTNNSELTELNKSNLNVIKETREGDNILNQSFNNTTNNNNEYIQKLQNEQMRETYQKRTNMIDGVDGMSIPEMNDSVGSMMTSSGTILPMSRNHTQNQKFKNLNPTDSTISIFINKMNSPPVWRTVNS